MNNKKNKLKVNTIYQVTPLGKLKTIVEKSILNIDDVIKDLPLPAVEFGGPTYDNYKNLIDINKLKNIIITNIKKTVKVEHNNFTTYKDLDIEMLIDATNMPFADKSLGTVLFSRLNSDDIYKKSKGNKSYRYELIKELNRKVINESYRVLKEKGILIYQGYFSDDVIYATQNGFDLLKSISIKIENEEIANIGAILIKESKFK